MPIPTRGQIVYLDLDPVRGHEQGGRRPALVISNDYFNRSAADLITVVPLTSKARPIRSFLKVTPPEAGLTQVSYIICDQIRTVSIRRVAKTIGSVQAKTMAEVEDRLRILLNL